MDEAAEYLLSYGLAGDFGRFRSVRPLVCRRGQRVVAETARGLEIATVLRPATARHAAFLPNTTVGRLLRPLQPDDEAQALRMRERAAQLFDRARGLVAELRLPLEPLDAEVLLDGAHAVLHHVRLADCDPRPLVSTLAREFDAHLLLTDLGGPSAPLAEEEEGHGCGSCGSEGGCGSCGSQGGCGSCGVASAADTQAHFAGLREQMERRRTPLL